MYVDGLLCRRILLRPYIIWHGTLFVLTYFYIQIFGLLFKKKANTSCIFVTDFVLLRLTYSKYKQFYKIITHYMHALSPDIITSYNCSLTNIPRILHVLNNTPTHFFKEGNHNHKMESRNYSWFNGSLFNGIYVL